MAACGTELIDVVTLDTCPSNGEFLLFMNATGGDGVGKYAKRTWQKVKSCLLNSIVFTFFQVQVNVTEQDSEIILPDGEDEFIIELDGTPLQDSLWISLDGPEMDRYPLVDRTTYSVVYAANSITITFLQATINEQVYVFHYAYLPS